MSDEYLTERKGKRDSARRLLLFRKSSDPTPQQLGRAKKVIGDAVGVAVVGEISGTLEISVDPGHETDLVRAAKSLKSWELVEEGIAQMPSSPLSRFKID